MSLEDLDNYCRKFSSMWSVFDELYSMRIHNDDNWRRNNGNKK